MKTSRFFLPFVVLALVFINCSGPQRPLDGILEDEEGSSKVSVQEEDSQQNGYLNQDSVNSNEAHLDNQSSAGEASATVSNLVKFSEIKPLFQKHCMLCHTAQMPPEILWTDYSVAKEYALDGRLVERVWTLRDDLAKSMPLGNAFQMTEDERLLVKKWVEDGAIE